jgi:hypothetical protein
MRPEFVQRLNVTFYVSHLTEKYSESVTIWYGSGSGSESADPYLCLKDPDPALFVSDLQDAYYKYFFASYFLKVRLHHSSNSQNSRNKRFFLQFLLDEGRILIWIRSSV